MRLHSYSVAVVSLFLLSGFANAGPASGLRRRQGTAFPSTETFQMTQTISSPNGPEIEGCSVVLTPVVDANGNNEVQEVQSCSVISSTGASVATSTLSGTVVPFPTLTTGSPTTTTPVISAPTVVPAPPVASSSLTTLSVPPPSSSAAPAAISVIGVTTIPIPTSSTPSSTVSSSTSSPAATSPDAVDGIASAASSTTDTSTDSATAAADNSASASATPFTLPGKKLQVLPIGLGVFAGITVIALVVVGLVTWERTKYRRAFRARKLAEQGAPMGNGSLPPMVERV